MASFTVVLFVHFVAKSIHADHARRRELSIAAKSDRSVATA
jgi:hypothetical protein